MSELSRLLDLVPYISSHQGISVTELARTFATTEREIVRNLNTLFMCGLPGYTPLELMEVDFEDGFVTIRNAETLSRPRKLSAVDSVTVMLALTEMSRDVSAPLDRISKLIEHLQRSAPLKVSISIPAETQVERTIVEAIRADRRIEFEYFSRYRDSRERREVSPLELREHNGLRYLSGYCHSARSVRTFALERIADLKTLESGRYVPEYREERIEVLSKIYKRYRKFTELLGGEKFTTFSPLWAVRTAIAASGDLEITEPRAIRDQVRERAQSALAQYRSLM